MAVGLTTTYVISVYHHLSCVFEPCLWQGALDTKLCDKVCQWLAAGQWSSPGTPVSPNNKTDRHDITQILLKMALNIINHKPINQLSNIISSFRQNLFIVDTTS